MDIKDLIVCVRHIGVYVEDMDGSLATLADIFDHDPDTLFQVPPAGEPASESRFAFIPVGGMDFELIQPISDTFKKLVSNPPPGINHIAFTVTDIEQAVAIMQKKGVRLGHVTPDAILDMPKSRVAYFNKEDTAGILIEFVEPKSDAAH
jgi:catechol 2,3-dioxygenase-like lactoylglutathione lyase family enzyme